MASVEKLREVTVVLVEDASKFSEKTLLLVSKGKASWTAVNRNFGFSKYFLTSIQEELVFLSKSVLSKYFNFTDLSDPFLLASAEEIEDDPSFYREHKKVPIQIKEETHQRVKACQLILIEALVSAETEGPKLQMRPSSRSKLTSATRSNLSKTPSKIALKPLKRLDSAKISKADSKISVQTTKTPLKTPNKGEIMIPQEKLRKIDEILQSKKRERVSLFEDNDRYSKAKGGKQTLDSVPAVSKQTETISKDPFESRMDTDVFKIEERIVTKEALGEADLSAVNCGIEEAEPVILTDISAAERCFSAVFENVDQNQLKSFELQPFEVYSRESNLKVISLSENSAQSVLVLFRDEFKNNCLAYRFVFVCSDSNVYATQLKKIFDFACKHIKFDELILALHYYKDEEKYQTNKEIKEIFSKELKFKWITVINNGSKDEPKRHIRYGFKLDTEAEPE